MQLRQATCTLIVLVLAASGCTSPGPLDDSDSAWPEPRSLGQGMDAVRPPRTAEAYSDQTFTFAEPSAELTLRRALAASLLQSPHLAATGFEVRAHEAEMLQASLFPNPEIDVEFENFGGTGELDTSDSLETTLALSQLIELGGKRVKRQQIARYQAQNAGWEYEIQRIDVLSKTAVDYVNLLAAERRMQTAIKSSELAQRVFDAVGERVDAGKISPVERAKAQVELAQAGLGRDQAVRAVQSARIRLASNWGSTSPQFETVAGNLDQTNTVPSLESMLKRIDENPDVARWASAAALRQAEIELALAQRVPDLTISGGLRYFNEIDETAFVAGFSMPLPIFDQNQGNIQAARLRGLQSDQLERAARVHVQTAVTEAYQTLDAALVSVNTIRSQILPSAEHAFEAAEEAFRHGKIGALGLLDAERTLFDARRQLTNALTTYHLAVIASERLIGAPLHDVGSPKGSNQ